LPVLAPSAGSPQEEEDTDMVLYQITNAARWPVEVYRRHCGRWVFVGAAASLDVARKRWGPK